MRNSILKLKYYTDVIVLIHANHIFAAADSTCDGAAVGCLFLVSKQCWFDPQVNYIGIS